MAQGFLQDLEDFLRRGWIGVVVTLVYFTPSSVLALEGELVILSSFSKQMTVAFRKGFAAKNPRVNIRIVRKKTGDAVEYLSDMSVRNTADLFWASSPDAFEILKERGLLSRYTANALDLPLSLGASSLNDPQGFYTGFAASGYGFMWNTRFLRARGLAAPADWRDLTRREFFGHVAMCSPSRSGTTHLIVESILQTEGWEKGWKLVKSIAGNLKTVTNKSSDVPRGVRDGRYTAGLVIDFYGLSAKAKRYPVEFRYPEHSALLAANIGIVRDAPNRDAAEAFVEYLLEPETQTLLLNANIRRLPVRPEVYTRAPDDYPNPFKDANLKVAKTLDVELSARRYNLVNSLFDVMVTYNLNELRQAVYVLQTAESLLEGKNNPVAAERLKTARKLLGSVLIEESRATESAFTGLFTQNRKRREDKISGSQKNIEDQWDVLTKATYQRILNLADEALQLLTTEKLASALPE